MTPEIRVQAEDFDVGAELARLEATGAGGVASFTGVVRGDDGLATLLLQHHAGMTAPALRDIAGDAARRWPLTGLTVIHRVGTLRVGERIVFVGTSARHRRDALESCAFLIDWLKTKAPFWKRETSTDGTSRWIEPRSEDELAAARWEASG